MKQRISAEARRDIAAVLDWSQERFGLAARVRYEQLIFRALDTVTQSDDPPGSRATGPSAELRVYHLRYCRADPAMSSVARPRHVVVYRRVAVDRIVIVRLLHDAMDLPAHLAGN